MKKTIAVFLVLLLFTLNGFAITDAESRIIQALTSIQASVSGGVIVSGAVNFTGAANGSTTQVTALQNGTAHVNARATRRYIAIQNASTTEKIYYGFSTGVTASNGFHIDPGSSQSLSYTGAVYFYSVSGGAVVECVESYD